MTRNADVDTLIREALAAEDAQGSELLGEPGWPAMVTEVFRSRLRWLGAVFMAMVLVFFVLAVFCAVRFLAAADDAGLIRWGFGFLFCVITVIAGKIWYWMETGRLATLREIKRVELLIAHLAAEIRTT